MKKVLITGGAGFIGSNLAVALQSEGDSVVCFDNLSRRGSEILLRRIQEYGCSFVHGDVRNPEDFLTLKDSFDVLVECSADPSVLVGINGDEAGFQISNNLYGTVNCLEFARIRCIPVLFLSTSRVYPYTAINKLVFSEDATRFRYADDRAGVSSRGIATSFPLQGLRSLYGAAKLCSEYLLQEYSGLYNLPGIINRCGVIAGPWQLGKADQGIFTYWLHRHYYSKSLKYIGYGGTGKQVRDLLHVDDLTDLLKKQIAAIVRFRGEIFNVGGSTHSSLSLREATDLCRSITGNTVPIAGVAEDRAADLKWYITDNGNTESVFDWQPRRNPEAILGDTFSWLSTQEELLSSLFKGN